jgi:endonuclease/exonuclease/phosphatase family metal-dependent hydrolase
LQTRGLPTQSFLQIALLSRNHSCVLTLTQTQEIPAPEHGIELGNQAALAERTDGEQSKLVLASYNIRYAVGQHLISSGLLRKARLNFPRHRADAVSRNIQTAGLAFSENTLLPRPDILALQEADKETGRAGGQHVAARLAEELGMSYVHVGAGLPQGIKPKQREWWLNFEEQIGLQDVGDTGVALLSRIPLSKITRIDLPWHECPWRPRLAMAVAVELGGQELRLFNAHIDPHGPIDNQHQQIERVLEHAARHDGPTIILGDFNTLSKQKAIAIRQLMEAHGYTTPFPTGTATWRGAGLRFHADWIFVRGVSVNRWGVAKPLNVSDHWPIWAEIKT